MVLIWALRLGFFLFIRVLKAGEDRRFREVKQKFSGFLVWWTLSALWVFLTTVNALVMIINNVPYHSDYYIYIGLLIWIIGFSFEVVADEQKRRFRLQSSNKDQFISTGLWSISRHPNYFGEILLWIGMAVIAFPTLQGWQHISLISPIFIYLLLTRVGTIYYFLHFLVVLPVVGYLEKTDPLPVSISDPIMTGGANVSFAKRNDKNI